MFNFLDDVVRDCSDRIQSIGGSIVRYDKGPPVDTDELDRVSRKLGGRIPPELVELGRFAKHFEFRWRMSGEEDQTIPGVNYPHGRLYWDFSGFEPLDPRDYWWAEEIIDGQREGIWHKKIVMDCASDGDFLAYTISPTSTHVPVYCAKDGTGPTEFVLGETLADFYRAWARIGFLSINELYEWPRRTGLDKFDVSYFREFEMLLSGHAVHRVLP